MWPSNGLHMSMYVREVRYMYMYGCKVKKVKVKVTGTSS